MKRSHFLLTVFSFMTLSFFISCTNEAEQKETKVEVNGEELEESLDNLKESLEEVGNNLQESGENAAENLEEALSNLGESLQDIKITKDGEEVEVVSFREIKKIMPSRLAGLSQDETSGETTGAFGINVSTAEAIYKKGDKKIELNITDTGGVGLALLGMAAWSKIEVDRESKTEVEYTTKTDGYKSYVKFNKKNLRGEWSIIVDDRFIVQLNSRNVDLDDLEEAVEDLRLKKLSRKLT